MTVLKPEDVPVGLEMGNMVIRSCPIGDMVVTFYQVPKGVDFRPMFKGLAEDLCQCPHYGYMLKGKWLVHTKTGDELVEPGMAFYVDPGHWPEALEDCEFVEFSPTEEFMQLAEHITGKQQVAN